MLHHFPLPVAPEVPIAEIALLEYRVFGDRAGQRAFVERYPRQQADVRFTHQRKQVRLGSLVEDVVDNLNRIHQARPDQIQRGIRLDLVRTGDRKSTRLNSSHPSISYAVFCLKKKKKNKT